MSWKHTDAVMELVLPTNEKIVFLALAHSRNHKTGACYPSRKTLARLSGLAESTVGVQLNRLRDRGLIEYMPGNGRVSNMYTLNIQPTGSRCVNPESNPPIQGSNPPIQGSNPPADEPNPPAAGYEQGLTGLTEEQREQPPQDLNIQSNSNSPFIDRDKNLSRSEKKKVHGLIMKKLKEQMAAKAEEQETPNPLSKKTH